MRLMGLVLEHLQGQAQGLRPKVIDGRLQGRQQQRERSWELPCSQTGLVLGLARAQLPTIHGLQIPQEGQTLAARDLRAIEEKVPSCLNITSQAGSGYLLASAENATTAKISRMQTDLLIIVDGS